MHSPTYSKILVPIDTSYEGISWTQDALDSAVELARHSNGTIHVISVVPENLFRGYYPDLYTEDVMNQAKDKLEKVISAHCPDDIDIVVSVERGGICSEIIHTARKDGADVIVMASHGPLNRDFLLGSNAAYIALHAPCSVFVIRQKAMGAMERSVA